jgi:hypothetical protein
MITVELNSRELEFLTLISQRRDMTESAILRQALRFYQMYDFYISSGHELAFRQPNGEYVAPFSISSKFSPMPEEPQ